MKLLFRLRSSAINQTKQIRKKTKDVTHVDDLIRFPRCPTAPMCSTFPKSRVGDLFQGKRSATRHARLSPRSCLRAFLHSEQLPTTTWRFVVVIFQPLLASVCFVRICEPRVRKACGGGLPKLSRNNGDTLKGAFPSMHCSGQYRRALIIVFFTSCSVTSKRHRKVWPALLSRSTTEPSFKRSGF